jgi:hypothetical protein
MAASFMYSFFTAFGVILIGAGLALQVLYIEQEINKEDNSYLPMQIASILINTLVVVYLLISITFYRPYQSNFGLFGSISVLLLGLAGEIYLTNFGENDIGKAFAYTFAGINALTRLYLLIAVRCDSYLTTIPGLVNEISKQAKNTGQSVDKVAAALSKELTNQGAQLSTVDPDNLKNNLFGQINNDWVTLLRSSSLSDDDKKKIDERFRSRFDKPPRQGGRR